MLVPEKPTDEAERVLISYSFRDEHWKNRLVCHLKTLEKHDCLDLWDDRRLGLSHAWENQMQEALESANTVILLISANYLTSRFILMDVFFRLLVKRHAEGLSVIPVLIQPCCWNAVEGFESVPVYAPANRALSKQDDYQIEQHLNDLAAAVFEANPHLHDLAAAPMNGAAGHPAPTMITRTTHNNAA